MTNTGSMGLSRLTTVPTSAMLTISLHNFLRIMSSMTTHSLAAFSETEAAERLEEEALEDLEVLVLEDRCLAMTRSLKIWVWVWEVRAEALLVSAAVVLPEAEECQECQNR